MRTLYVLLRILPFLVSFRRDVRRWIVAGAPARRNARFHARRADAMVRAIATLGPSFVKIAQVFAGRADLIPEPYLAAITSLTDRVPPIPLHAVERVVREAYGVPPSELFEEWDTVPVASASLGQVHRARWRGHDVAVKVLRPGVEHMVRRDIVAATRIVHWAGRLFPNPHVRGLRAILGEFARRIGDEMDFRTEAAYAEDVRANFANDPRVAVPKVYAELTRRTVLVLEFMEGCSIDALAPLVESGRFTARQIAESVMEMYVKMMLVDGLFHADPHPGNLLWRDDGTLVLLDFGLVVRVPRATRRALIRTVFAAIRKDPAGVVDGFYALGVVQPGVPRATVEQLVGALLGIAFERTTALERMEFVQRELLADRVLAALYDFPVTLPPDMVYFARTAALIEGIGARYDPRFNALTVAAPIALRRRREILASLDGELAPRETHGILALLGEAGSIVARAARELGALALDTLVTRHDSMVAGLKPSAAPDPPRVRSR